MGVENGVCVCPSIVLENKREWIGVSGGDVILELELKNFFLSDSRTQNFFLTNLATPLNKKIHKIQSN